MSREDTARGRDATDRGVSTAVGYVLTLGIAAILISGLLIGVSGFVEDQKRTTIRNEFEVVGEQLAADLASADRLVRAGSTYSGDAPSTVEVDRRLPATVTGSSYQIRVRDDPTSSNTLLKLSTENPDVEVTISLRLQTSVSDNTVSGGSVRIVYTGSDLEVRG